MWLSHLMSLRNLSVLLGKTIVIGGGGGTFSIAYFIFFAGKDRIHVCSMIPVISLWFFIVLC